MRRPTRTDEAPGRRRQPCLEEGGHHTALRRRPGHRWGVSSCKLRASCLTGMLRLMRAWHSQHPQVTNAGDAKPIKCPPGPRTEMV